MDALDVDLPVGVVVAVLRGALEQAPRDDVDADAEVVLLHGLVEVDGDGALLVGRGCRGRGDEQGGSDDARRRGQGEGCAPSSHGFSYRR
ncbi:hypothetical protein NS183_11385 [Microbacterium testaceum]|nr:hypothetical protein NS283_09680 [Microbacterium testaceum]KTS86203.1 hypothetical protein NS183_11385 [Microbacterium testaceum]